MNCDVKTKLLAKLFSRQLQLVVLKEVQNLRNCCESCRIFETNYNVFPQFNVLSHSMRISQFQKRKQTLTYTCHHLCLRTMSVPFNCRENFCASTITIHQQYIENLSYLKKKKYRASVIQLDLISFIVGNTFKWIEMKKLKLSQNAGDRPKQKR